MDSRFTLKGTFSIYGKDFPIDMSLNWSPELDGVDHRISEFFRSSYEDAYDCYMNEMDAAREDRQREETESKERAELARLKAKYEDSP